jgi:hypothetical protein
MTGIARSIAKREEEVLVPLATGSKGLVEPATHIRSTQIAASVLALRAHGFFDRYLQGVAVELHEPILRSVPGTWLPIDVGVAHYRAAEALGLTVDQQLAMGRGVAERIQNGLLGTLVRMAKGAGVTPWTGLEYVPKLWQRTLIGGAVAVYRLGPKEARVECHGAPELAELSYFRNGFRGMFASSGLLFCSKIYVHDLVGFTMRRIIGFRVAWA